MAHSHSEPRERPMRIQVFHSTAPTCFWSWGYEAVFNRLRLVYGDQIDIQVQIACVYEDFDEYLKRYELTFEGMKGWTEEAIEIMRIPLYTDYRREKFPRSVLPASLASIAANRQGERKGARYFRALLRRSCVEGQDVTEESIQLDAAREATLDLDAFREALQDEDGLSSEYHGQGDEFYHMPLGFYNVIVTDGRDRTVILDYAFDPPVVEEAVDYLSRGQLAKRSPTDLVGYLRDHGPAPTVEIARVFGLTQDEAAAKLGSLRDQGRATARSLAGAPHWSA